jgi:hypothetical protein
MVPSSQFGRCSAQVLSHLIEAESDRLLRWPLPMVAYTLSSRVGRGLQYHNNIYYFICNSQLSILLL